jgi:hypothetical protein
MRQLVTLALALALAPALFAEIKTQPLPPMTPEKWRADVDYFARELPKRHKNAFHHATREQFAGAVEALRAKSATANDDAMFTGFQQLAAMIGDGHTRVNIGPGMLHQFPIGVLSLEGQYRVVRGAGPAADLVGGRLTKIDGTPVAEAAARIRTIIAQAESEILIQSRVPQWLSIAEALHGLGVTKSRSEATYTVTMDDGLERSATVRRVEEGTKPEWRLAATKIPLYRQKTAQTFWFEWLPESQTVYVNFRGYEDLKAKARELWAFVDAHPVKKIAIDLRQNGGGDYTVGRRHVVDELARRPSLRGYVITGAGTFSAALKNAIDFRDVAKATLVGETIGEKPNSYSENDEMTLPNSRLSISYSTRYYRFLPGDGLVAPDREILPAWADWVAGRDPVLEWIEKQ